MKRLFIIIGLIFVLVLSSLFYLFEIHRINKRKPPAAVTEVYTIDIPQSTFNFRIKYGIKDLADYLNKKINGRFLEKKICIEKNNKEEIYLTLTKNDKITIAKKGAELVCTFPVTVDAKLENSKYGKFLTGLVKPIHSSLIITLSTPVKIDNKWNITTRFKIKKYQWVEKPVLQIGPFKKSIESRLDDVINENNYALTTLLDKEIYKAATLKPTFTKIWSDLQEPILISSKPGKIWIKFICSDIKGKMILTPSNIICITNMHAKTFILTDSTAQVQQKSLPEFKVLKQEDEADKSNIYIYAFTSFEEINKQLNRLLKGKTFSAKGHSLVIKEIQAYSSTSGLSVKVLTDKNDDLVASGHLIFDVPTKTLKVQNFDFALAPKSRFISLGDDFFHHAIRDSIAAKLVINLDTLIGKVPNIINKAIEKEKAGKVIDLIFSNMEIKQCGILMGKEKIHLIINVGVEASIKLKKIQTGTVIRIKDKSKKSNKHRPIT